MYFINKKLIILKIDIVYVDLKLKYIAMAHFFMLILKIFISCYSLFEPVFPQFEKR